VQDLLDGNGGGPIAGRRAEAARWLDGRLFDRHGRPMRTTYATRSITSGSVRQSKRYWYYVSKPEDPEDKRPLDRLPAGPLEGLVRDAIARQLADRAWISDALSAVMLTPDELVSALERARAIAVQDKPERAGEQQQPLDEFAHSVAYGDGALAITIDLAPLTDRATSEPVLAPAVRVPISLRRNGRNRPIVLETNSASPRHDAELIVLVADERRWMDDLVQGRARTVAEITDREGLRPGEVSRILPLVWLAPDIATAILEGRQPADLTARRLRDVPDLPLDWSEQRCMLGFPSP
jgi:hypothetical protein